MQGAGERTRQQRRLCWYHCRSYFEHETADMLELNPVRQRITDLTDRVVSLRGYL